MLGIQLSNILNDLTDANPFLRWYMWGLPSDVNTNRPNNYDQNSSTGRLFPMLLQVYEPIRDYDIQDSATGSRTETHVVTLHFIDRYNTDGLTQDQNRETQKKRLARLEYAAKLFLGDLGRYVEDQALPAFNLTAAILDPQPQTFTAGSVHLVVSFNIVVPVGCLESDIDLESILPIDPNDEPTFDKEDSLDNQPVF